MTPSIPSYPGYVYLLGSSRFGWFKIGKSTRPDIRVNELGILLPFKIELFALWGTRNHSLLESALHREYADHRINGEWFCFNRKVFDRAVCEYPPYWGTRIFPVDGVEARPIAASAETDQIKKLSNYKKGNPDHYKAFRAACVKEIAARGLDPKVHKTSKVKQQMASRVSGLWYSPIAEFVQALNR